MAKDIRTAYGEALLKYGADNRVVALDADVSSSTKSSLFGEKYPERFFNVGIAEANMTAMAAGFAAAGKIPFVNTFAAFLASLGMVAACSQGSYSKLGMKLMGAYGGLSDSFDGPSHQSVQDIAVMRTLPDFKVYVPSDEFQVDWLVKNAIQDAASPMYIRLSREAFPIIYKADTVFESGKGMVLREGGDITIIACGIMVGKALEAAAVLQEQGIDAAVIDMFCIKPLDRSLIMEYAHKTGAILTAEEHSVLGGLGGAVAETVCTGGMAVPMGFIGLADCHAECGPYGKLLHKYGLDAEAIVSKANSLLKMKGTGQL